MIPLARRGRAWLGAAILALALAATLGGCRSGGTARRPPLAGDAPGGRAFAGDPSDGALALDSLAVLDPATAYARALSLGERQRFAESLPYFRRALATPTSAWQPHADFAISLFHAALEGRVQRGVLRPRTRSSDERVRLLREAARELDLAEVLATTDAERAIIRARRARHLAAFGFPWDAYAEYVRSARVSSERPDRAEELLRALRDPLHAER